MDWTTTERHDWSDTTVVSRTTFIGPRSAPPSIAIAMALSELEDTPPSQTTFTMTDGVDPDALDDLMTDDTDDVTVAFTVADYRIVAYSNGRVQIRADEE